MSAFPWDKDYVKPPAEKETAIRERRVAAGKASGVARREKSKKTEVAVGESKPHGPLYYLDDENITHRQLEQIQAFVDAYLQTWSPGQSWLMSGGSREMNATKAGFDMLQSPAVQKRLQAVVDAMDEEKLLTRKTVLVGLLREANHFTGDATHGGRIRAWMGLARIKKMDVQVVEQNVNVRGGVMIIPGTPDGQIIDVEMWEKTSEEQQTLLKEEVRK